jgi:hypothetical protein
MSDKRGRMVPVHDGKTICSIDGCASLNPNGYAGMHQHNLDGSWKDLDMGNCIDRRGRKISPPSWYKKKTPP